MRVATALHRVHEVIELLQRLGRRQFQARERLDGGAQPPHGDRGAHPVPRHVADDQRDPPAGQADRLIPVAADLDERRPGRYRCFTSTEEGAVRSLGSMDRCKVRAVACSRLYCRAASMSTAARVANSVPISISYWPNLWVPGSRVQTKNPRVMSLAISGKISIETPASSLATGLRRHCFDS